MLDRQLLIGEGRLPLMVEPSELLEDFGMVRVLLKDAFVRLLGEDVLEGKQSARWPFPLMVLAQDVPLSAAHGHDRSGTKCRSP